MVEITHTQKKDNTLRFTANGESVLDMELDGDNASIGYVKAAPDLREPLIRTALAYAFRRGCKKAKISSEDVDENIDIEEFFSGNACNNQKSVL